MPKVLIPLMMLGWNATLALAQEGITRETLQDIKGATVFVKTQVGPVVMSGSGFVLKVDGDRAFVATNHHVVAPPKTIPSPRTAARVVVRPVASLVFWSGTKEERTVGAEVLASDPERDLAILSVKRFEGLPKPIDYSQPPEVTETMPVFIFGFPFGQMLATGNGSPAITVGRGSISSIRLDNFGRKAVVQIDGALNPGNSGGPVVDAKGRLVGIAVATIRGANIGLAIPPDQLTKMLDGRVSGLTLGTRITAQGVAVVTISAQLIDPLLQVKSVALHHARADSSVKQPERNQDGTWPPMAGTERVELKLEGQRCSAELTLRSDERSVVKYWWQTSYTDGAGKTNYSSPVAFSVDYGRTVAGVRPATPARRTAPSPPSPDDEPQGGFPSELTRPPATRKQDLSKNPKPAEAPQGGFAKELLAPDFATPTATGESLEGQSWNEGDLSATELKLDRTAQILPCLFWEAAGKSFFVLDQSGSLRRISLNDLREEMRWEVNEQCRWLSPSAEGLLLTVTGLQEVWVLDPTDFRVKAKVAIPSAERTVSSPPLSVGFSIGDPHQQYRTLRVIDLKKGQVVREYGTNDFPDRLAYYASPVVTPSGKYLFTQGGSLLRFRIHDDALELEEASRERANSAHVRGIALSPDGYYVSLLSTFGTGQSNGTKIYKITDLSRPEIVIPSNPGPMALGFDLKAGLIFADHPQHPLVLFRPNGTRLKEYSLASPVRQGGRTRQFLVHPDGGKVLVLTDSKIVLVTLPRSE